jgi:uncharacterized protein YukE
MRAMIADLKADMEQLRERWEQVQPRLVAEVERTNEENTRLTQAMSTHRAELEKVRKEQDEIERRYKAELTIAQLEVSVASEFEDDDEDDPAEQQEPSLLHVLNED